MRVFPAALSHETIIQNELLLLPPGYDEDTARELRVDIIIALTRMMMLLRGLRAKKVATAFKLTLNTRNNMLSSIMTIIFSYEI